MGQLSKYNANLLISHLQVAQKIVKYLKRTMQIGIIFEQASATKQLPQDLPSYDLIRYTDSNFAKDLED